VSPLLIPAKQVKFYRLILVVTGFIRNLAVILTLINETVSTPADQEPTISIVTVTFNAQEYLQQTIDSVAVLDYPHIRFIVIDGGSTDATVQIIRKNAEQIHYWVSEKDRGIYDAFNKGWSAADPQGYVLYLGAGDKILTLPAAENMGKADVIYGKVILDEKVTFQSKVDFRLKLGNTLHHQALLVRKRLAPEPPFDLQFRTYADFDFNQRLLKKGVKFLYDDHFLSYALPGGVSQQFKTAESLSIVRKNFGPLFSLAARGYYFLQGIRKKRG
jgi:glycosyltransferase involved in cell wall biosynthesis